MFLLSANYHTVRKDIAIVYYDYHNLYENGTEIASTVRQSP